MFAYVSVMCLYMCVSMLFTSQNCMCEGLKEFMLVAEYVCVPVGVCGSLFVSVCVFVCECVGVGLYLNFTIGS